MEGDVADIIELDAVQPIQRDGEELHVWVDVINNLTKQVVKILYLEDAIVADDKKPKKDAPVMEMVGTMRGLTLNLGNYQSARISVWRQRVCEPSDADKAYGAVAGWCEARVEWERCKIRGVVPVDTVLKVLGKTEADFWAERGSQPTAKEE